MKLTRKKWGFLSCIGLCFVFIGVIFGFNKPAEAYYVETPADNGGLDVCFAPVYKISHGYSIRDEYWNKSGAIQVPDNERTAFESRVATYGNRICVYVGPDRKFVEDSPIWLEGSFGADQNWNEVATPKLQNSAPLYGGGLEIYVTPTIDCRDSSNCSEGYSPGFNSHVLLDNRGTIPIGYEKTGSTVRSLWGKDIKDAAYTIARQADSYIKNRTGNDSDFTRRDRDIVLNGPHGNATDTFKQVVNSLSDDEALYYLRTTNWTYTYVDDLAADVQPDDLPQPGTPVTPGGGNTQTKATCSNSAGALGWVLCPALEGIGNAIDSFYKNVIKPLLIIEPELISSDNATAGTYGAWNIMRNFANIAFVILLLVVIFSQLTSVGIDNYGIKKILPKLVVMAILVNLSYFICQALVDVSNIIGNSLDSFLTSMGNSLGTNVDVQVNQQSLNIAGGASAAIGGVGAAAGIGIMVVIIKGIIAGGAFMSVLGSLLWGIFCVALVVAVALAVFFVMLAVRKAGVIILVVIAPLAIVCYTLPNTKSLFDKWRKIFTALLVLFPICGLVVGGGNLAAQIIMKSGNTSDNFWLALVAIAASIVPIFCIPLLLKNTMQAFGTLGAKLAGLTGKGKVLSGKVKSTDAYKNARNRARIGTKYGIYNGDSKISKMMRRAPGGTRRAQEAISAYNKERDTNIDAERTIINQDPNLDTETLAGEYATLLQKPSWSKKDEIRAEALHREIGGRAGGGGMLNSLIAGEATKNGQKITFDNNHLTNMQAFNRRDSKAAGAAYEKSPPHSYYLQACQGPNGYKGKFQDWIKTADGKKAVQSMSTKDLVHMKAGSIKDIQDQLTAQQLSDALHSDDLGKAEFNEVKQALDAAQTSQQNRYNNAQTRYNQAAANNNVAARNAAYQELQELRQMGFGP